MDSTQHSVFCLESPLVSTSPNQDSACEPDSQTGLREECGVAGVIGDKDASKLIYLALYALQHRGQEASGIVTSDKLGAMHQHKDFGLVKDVFSEDSLRKLKGAAGIGHNRYSTHGGQLLANIQPFAFPTSVGPIAIAQNGNITNATTLRQELELSGSVFHSTSDTEVLIHLFARANSPTIAGRLREVLPKIRGAYSLLILSRESIFAVRDPFGFRPLVLGRRGKSAVVASESCALDLMDAEMIREVLPGEIVELDINGSLLPHEGLPAKTPGFCSFEPIYFSRPDSVVFGRQVYELRRRMGEILAEESHVDADIVISVPDSGTPLAIGYGAKVGLPVELGLVRNHYIGRTFIEPSQTIRDFGVKLKLNPIRSVLMGKKVVVVDDSLVRGTTSVKILRLIRKSGAKEVHLRLGSPPITHSCYFGVDTPNRSALLAAQKNIDEIRTYIGADSVAFLSREGLKRALGEDGHRYCMGCFSGCYPEETEAPKTVQPTDAIGGPGYASYGPKS